MGLNEEPAIILVKLFQDAGLDCAWKPSITYPQSTRAETPTKLLGFRRLSIEGLEIELLLNF